MYLLVPRYVWSSEVSTYICPHITTYPSRFLDLPSFLFLTFPLPSTLSMLCSSSKNSSLQARRKGYTPKMAVIIHVRKIPVRAMEWQEEWVLPLTHEVAQRSILGPLLFLVMVATYQNMSQVELRTPRWCALLMIAPCINQLNPRSL